MEKKTCKSCGRQFRPHPQTPHQQFCSAEACQRERRRRTQQKRRRKDADYRDNDARNHKDWAIRNPAYWKQYRQSNPDYADRNKKLQKIRNQRNRSRVIAKVDVSHPLTALPSGRYVLTPYRDGVIANVDAWIVEIAVLACPPGRNK